MKVKSIAQTNPYLSNPEMRQKLVTRSVRSSCGVEGIKAKPGSEIEIPRRTDKKIYKSTHSK